MAYGEINQQVYKHSGTYAQPMNDLTTAFAVPKSEGNARAEDVSKHSAVSRGEIAECSCEVVGRSVRQYCPKAVRNISFVVSNSRIAVET